MSIDLGTNPTVGNEATAEQKEQIRAALGLNNFVDKDTTQTLTNKTLNNVNITGTTFGQLELPNQQPVSNNSAITGSTFRRELLFRASSIQNFNMARTWNIRGGANPDRISGSAGNDWVDTIDRPTLSVNANTTGIDHTSYATKIFGCPYLNNASGGAVNWSNNPCSFSFRFNNISTPSNGQIQFHLGVCGNWSAGIPAGKGVGIFRDKDGFKLWSHDGTTFNVTADAGDTVFTSSAAHGYSIGDKIRFTKMPSNSLVVNSTYYVVAAPTPTSFSVSNTINGSPIATTVKLEGTGTPTVYNAIIPALPTYKAVTWPWTGDMLQLNQHILITTTINSSASVTASLYWGIATDPFSTTAVDTIAAPLGSSIPTMALTCTSAGAHTSSSNSHLSVVNASFAPFAP